VVCLDCGKQFSYDPKQMRIGKVIENGAGGVPARVNTTPAATRIVRAAVAAIPAAIMFLITLFRVKRNPSK